MPGSNVGFDEKVKSCSASPLKLTEFVVATKFFEESYIPQMTSFDTPLWLSLAVIFVTSPASDKVNNEPNIVSSMVVVFTPVAFPNVAINQLYYVLSFG